MNSSPAAEIEPIGLPSQRHLPANITQATAVEQSRAIAEVQAAVVVAQQVPRDMGAAEADMRDACGRLGLAQRAFYSVPNRGNGPSVHLARELARIFGNVQYGVHELRRDDAAGMSEIQAFAWDVEKNVRSTRTFQVPHQRMKKVKGVPTRDPLVDLTDVYLNNQNIGARAVRECIFTILPAWFTDAAQDLCHRTLVEGEGKPLDVRVADMVRAFAGIGVTDQQLENKIGRKRSAWRPVDIAQMTIVYQSIQRGEVTKDDAFPVQRVTAAEVLSADQNPPSHPVTKPDTPTQTAPVQAGEATDEPRAGDDRGPSVEEQQAEIRRLSEDRRRLAADPEPDPADTDDKKAPPPSVVESPAPAGRATGPRCTVSQQAEISRHFSRLDVLEADERAFWIHHFAGLPDGTVAAAKELKKVEADQVIAALAKFTGRDELDASLNQDSLLGDHPGRGDR